MASATPGDVLVDDTHHELSIQDLTRGKEQLGVLDGEGDEEAAQQAQEMPDRATQLQAELDALRRFREPLQQSVDALLVASAQNHRLAERVEQTSTLLDEYTRILGQQEHTRTLMQNEHWKGASEDARVLQQAQEEQQRVEQERAVKEEQKRQAELEEKKRVERESELRAANAASSTSNRGSVRGRGTRVAVSGRGRGLSSSGGSSSASSSSGPSVRPQSRIPPPGSRIPATRGRGGSVTRGSVRK